MRIIFNSRTHWFELVDDVLEKQTMIAKFVHYKDAEKMKRLLEKQDRGSNMECFI